MEIRRGADADKCLRDWGWKEWKSARGQDLKALESRKQVGYLRSVRRGNGRVWLEESCDSLE